MRWCLPVLIPLVMGVPTAWAEVSIQNDQRYVGDDGARHIVGEVSNDLGVPLDRVRIHAALHSESGQLIGSVSSHPLVNNIMPGMKAPFDIIISGAEARGFDTYVLDLEYDVGAPKSQVMDITSSRLSTDGLDNLVITGTVANNGDATANAISVVATLYDRQGNVAAVSRTHTEPDYLRSSGESFFLISVPDRAQASTAVDYSLVAESEEYAAVPEFPLGSGVLLASSVLWYLAMTKYWNRAIEGVAAAADLR